jgi:cytosine/adenosine deaminase-related metal-dependent hydrolase
MAAGRTLIKDAWLVTLDDAHGDIPRSDILIEDGRIAAIGPDLGVEDAEVIDGTHRIAIPGFVDSHRHTWQTAMRGIAADWTLTQYFVGMLATLGPCYRPQDTYAGNLLGALECLDAGITTLVDWSHDINSPDHADAAITALHESGIRGVFAHGNANSIWMNPDSSADWSDIERLRGDWFASDDQLLTLALALRGPDFGGVDVTEDDWRTARELGLRISVHIGVGGFGNRSVAALNDRGLLGPDTTYIHCSRLDPDEFQMIADTGGTASVASEVEMHMGHGHPPTRQLLAVGIRPSLSIDVCTGIGGDMFTQMRTTLAMARALANHEQLEAGITPDHLDVTSSDVLEFATIEGARAAGLGHKIGSLTVGKDADIVLLRSDRLNLFPVNHPKAAVSLAANTSNVDTVLVRGRVVKRDGELVGVDLDRVRDLATESRDFLLSQCQGAHTGGSWTPAAYEPA